MTATKSPTYNNYLVHHTTSLASWFAIARSRRTWLTNSTNWLGSSVGRMIRWADAAILRWSLTRRRSSRVTATMLPGSVCCYALPGINGSICSGPRSIRAICRMPFSLRRAPSTPFGSPIPSTCDGSRDDSPLMMWRAFLGSPTGNISKLAPLSLGKGGHKWTS